MTLASALISGLYAVALGMGWIVNEAGVVTIAQTYVQAEEESRLLFVRQTKYDRLRFLNNLSEMTPDMRLEMESLRSEIADIDARLKQLKEQKRSKA